jgi:hypothetical protein
MEQPTEQPTEQPEEQPEEQPSEQPVEQYVDLYWTMLPPFRANMDFAKVDGDRALLIFPEVK